MKLIILILTLFSLCASAQESYLTLETKLHLTDSLKSSYCIIEQGDCHHHYIKRFKTKIYHYQEVENIEEFISDVEVSEKDVNNLTNYYLNRIRDGKIILPNQFKISTTLHIRKIKHKQHFNKIKYDFYLIITH
jgi:hypothetical protein